jgi:hypothetical protein
MCHKQCKA